MSRYSSYGNLDDQISEDLDQGFAGFNNKLRPDQLAPGTLAVSSNGRMDLNGEWQPRKGLDIFSSPFSAGVFTIPFYLYDSIPAVSSYSTVSETISITFASAHGIVNDTGISISGLTPTGNVTSPNGNFVASVTSSTTIDVVISNLGGNPTGTMVVSGMKLNADAGNFIEASCEYSDPNDDSQSYVACVGTNSTILVKTADSGATNTTISYPAGESVNIGATVLQSFNKLYIFRKGQVAMEWDGDFSSPAFTLVPNGLYSQPTRLGDNGNNTVISNGVVTVTSTGHGLNEGDVVVVVESSDQLVVGDSYTVASTPDANTFIFYAQYDDQSSHNNHYSKRVSLGLGFSHMPAPEFAVYHQKRLVVPYRYDYNSLGNIEERNILDEALFSDILDADTYDRIYGQFRFNAGTADFIVGFHSFSDDKLVVFNRNSIHIVTNSLDLGSASSQLITNEVGCLARDSVQQVGNSMIFLSDNGVYGLDFMDLYNLRGQDVPLSGSIEGTIKRINQAYAEKAKSVYFDNRYYLAVPLDSSTTNNALLIYNFVNQQWESVDSVNDPEWDYSNLTVAGSGDKRGVYVVNRRGGVHKYESRVDDRDNYVPNIGQASENTQIVATATTRMFTLNSLDRKKWNNFDIHVQSSEENTSDATLEAITENIDGIIDIGSLNSLNGSDVSIDEDVSLRGRFGNKRAYGLQIRLTTTKGRPRLRALKVAGASTFRSLQKAK